MSARMSARRGLESVGARSVRRVGLLVLGLLLGCRTTPVEPPPPPADPAALVAALRREAPGTLYAVLVLTVDAPERSGSFEAVMRWTPERLRLTAFKDLVLAIRPIFDLALRRDGYEFDGEISREQRDRGPLSSFPGKHPELAPLYWVREGLFLPGGEAELPVASVATADGPRWSLRGRLQSGAAVTWLVDPGSGEIAEAVVETPDGPLHVRYRAWADHQGRRYPGRVMLRHRQTTVRAHLDELEQDVELTDEEFALPR